LKKIEHQFGNVTDCTSRIMAMQRRPQAASGVAGTMWANNSGRQGDTANKIGLIEVTTLPAAVLPSAGLFSVGGLRIPGARPAAAPLALVAPGPEQQLMARVDERGRE
jgi:hypothetical protein